MADTSPLRTPMPFRQLFTHRLRALAITMPIPLAAVAAPTPDSFAEPMPVDAWLYSRDFWITAEGL